MKKWDLRMLEKAEQFATWSKDTSTKVGCVIVRGKRVLATGYNGFPEGIKDDIGSRNERPDKYLYTEHADRNAIYQAARFGISLQGAIMYLSAPPCADCVRGIIQSGIVEVVWPTYNTLSADPEKWDRWVKSIEIGLQMMMEAGVVYRGVLSLPVDIPVRNNH